MNKIIELELSLLDKNIRNNRNELEKIISKDFVEYAASGNIYNHEKTLNLLPSENENIKYKIIEMTNLAAELEPQTFGLTVQRGIVVL